MLEVIFYPNDLKKLEDPLFEMAFLNVYQELDDTMFTLIGNHDTKVKVQVQLYLSQLHQSWKLPNNRYSFKTGPTHFFLESTPIVISTPSTKFIIF